MIDKDLIKINSLYKVLEMVTNKTFLKATLIEFEGPKMDISNKN